MSSQPRSPTRSQRARRGGIWRELTGALALGLAALAVVVAFLQVLAWLIDTPGPGAFAVIGHAVAAAISVAAQRFSERSPRRPAIAAGLLVVLVLAAALWLFWWR
ncbi:hypothetical protein [Herbihabitans rhizosphaerae]|uniref:hypothetical protein n=1 Tax=Herbihabitans rhizosphaerae TaxID=1872711 RepID=UPI001F5FD7C7|nr:hypothetical protein [Herbihabitans rhizosphaerae]